MKKRLCFLSASFAVLGGLLLLAALASKGGMRVWPTYGVPCVIWIVVASAQLKALMVEEKRPAMPRHIGVADLYPPRGRP